MTIIALTVEGMSCNHCKMSIEKALKRLEGVSAAEVNLAAKLVQVTYDPDRVNVDMIRETITEEGYEVK